MNNQQKIRVCLIVEGAYPYVFGGVSIWIQQLISDLPEIDFVLWTVIPEKGQPYKFKLPGNVVEVEEIALSEKLRSGKRKRHVQSQWEIIRNFHNQLERGNVDQFESFCRQFIPHEPRALAPENLFRDFQGWQLITEKYNLHHPISPFVQYYWAWRAVHIPMFQMLQAPIPQADVYHAVSTGYAGFLGAIAKVVNRKPFLLTEHGIYTKEREIEINQSELYVGYQKRMWKKNFRGLARIAYAHADLIIALFRRNQEIQIQMGAPPERCQVIPNGIRVRDFQDIKPKPHKGFNVGFIGRMVPIKDVKNFIMAARIIKDEISAAHFYLIGPQEERDDYYQELLLMVDNLELKNEITFTGEVDVKKYFPILDVLCLSSIKEAQPLSVIEALVAGVPVVATDVGDVADILQNDGIVVSPKKPDKMAEGVIQFATDPKFRKRCIQWGRARARRDYDLDKIIQRYRELYQRYGTKEVVQWRA